MPALEAFGMKWKIGSDDLVFPYSFSLFAKVLWFTLTSILVGFNDQHQCYAQVLLRYYLFSLMAVQLLSCLIQLAVILVSARGTITDPRPRWSIKWIIYLHTIIFAVEFLWESVGVVWVFDPTISCASSHFVLTLTRFILIWNVAASVFTALYMFLRTSLQKLCPCNPKYKRLSSARSFGGRRLSKMSSRSLERYERRRRWFWVFQILFYCSRSSKSQGNVLREVSLTLSDAFEKFRGYVPSDILAGLLLVKTRHKEGRDDKERSDEEKERECTLQLSKETSDNNIKKIVHYYNFALGSYGWMLYIYTKGLMGLLQLLWSSLCRCFKVREPDGLLHHTSIAGDNLLGWSTLSVLKWTNIRKMDLIHANFSSNVCCPAYLVAIDHIDKSVVVAIRGTLSVADALIDLSAQPSLLMKKDGLVFYAHQGMKDSTYSLHMKLEGEGMLQKIFNIYPSYRLIITGHSLGAGVAALLSMMLKPVYPNLHCYAFSPPGGLINNDAVSFTKPFITSVILGSDIVSRLSLESFEFFSQEVLHEIETYNKPKFLVFLKSFFCVSGLKRRHEVKGQDDQINQPLLTEGEGDDKIGVKMTEEETSINTPENEKTHDDCTKDEFDSQSEEEILYITSSKGDNSMRRREDETLSVKRLPPPPLARPALYLPGNIIHIEREKLKPIFKLRFCFMNMKRREAKARWGQQGEFVQLLLDEEMVSDHLPDSLLEALLSLKENKEEEEEEVL